MRSSSLAGLAAAALLAPMGSVSTETSRRPDLVERAVAVSQHSVAPGAYVRVTDTVRNTGRATAAPSRTGYYLSHDRARNAGDLRLGSRRVGRLRPAASARAWVAVRIPVAAPPGSYRLVACADDRARVRESSEVNNCRAAAEDVTVLGLSGDRTPPVFAGLRRAWTCIPGPIGGGRSSSYRLTWEAATDDVTPSSQIVYDVYRASKPARENFSAPTYTAPAGATLFVTPPLPDDQSYYFVVRARDGAGNEDSNRVERVGENICL